MTTPFTIHTVRRGVLALAALCLMAGGAWAQAPITVEKTADAQEYLRYLWTIDKSTDATSVDLECGQTTTIDYEILVRKVNFYEETAVSGLITVTNNTNGPVMLDGVTDALEGSGSPQDIDVDLSGGLAIPAGDQAFFPYAGRAQSHNWTLNRATATLAATPYSGTAPLAPTALPDQDQCIVVSDAFNGGAAEVLDANGGTDGSVCTTDPIVVANAYTFMLSRPYTAPATPGTYPIVNTASFYGFNTGPDGAPDWNATPGYGSATGSDEVTVTANVTCATGGCSYTQGYWRTHSSYGPAGPADPTWDLVGGPDAAFFGTGQTWYQMFWTPPARGNTYVNLATQWMAARLNQLNGADVSVISTELADAASILGSAAGLACFNSPQSNTLCPRSLRTTMNELAGTLDDYNNGDIGPGHCGDGGTSARATTEAPATFALGAPYPNPFNPATTVSFVVPQAADVQIGVFDALGREVAQLAAGRYEAGTHTVAWDAGTAPSGTYFVVMRAGAFQEVRSIVLMK